MILFKYCLERTPTSVVYEIDEGGHHVHWIYSSVNILEPTPLLSFQNTYETVKYNLETLK